MQSVFNYGPLMFATAMVVAGLTWEHLPWKATRMTQVQGQLVLPPQELQRRQVVRVFAYDEATLKKSLQDVRRTAEQEIALRKSIFLDLLSQQQAAAKLSEEAAAQAEAARQRAEKTPGPARKEWEQAAELSRTAMSALEAAESASDRVRIALQELNAVRSPQFIFQYLPATTTFAQTDESGQFELSIAANRRVALAVSAPDPDGSAQPAFWLLWLPAGGTGTEPVVLDAHNTLARRPVNAVIDINQWPQPSSVEVQNGSRSPASSMAALLNDV